MKKQTVHFGVFTALALLFSYIESLIPFHIGIPGVKLGLANLIIVIALYKTDVRQTFLLSVTRVVLSGFMFGNLFSIIYSLAGGILSLLVMIAVKKNGNFSVIGVSIMGGVFHNVGQLLIAMLVTESLNLFYYVPVLMISGLVTGILIGIVSDGMLKRMRRIRFD